MERSLQSVMLTRYGLVQSDSIFRVSSGEIVGLDALPHNLFLGSHQLGLSSVQLERYEPASSGFLFRIEPLISLA